jgi:Mn2+/Fe2+ NRAMP family transporter
MTVLGISVVDLLAWPLAIALLGAGIINAAGSVKIKEDFLRWGYPNWWNRVTGALEILAAVLIAVPATRAPGLLLSAVICVAAVLTVVRFKDYGHVAPSIALTALSAVDLVLILR